MVIAALQLWEYPTTDSSGHGRLRAASERDCAAKTQHLSGELRVNLWSCLSSLLLLPASFSQRTVLIGPSCSRARYHLPRTPSPFLAQNAAESSLSPSLPPPLTPRIVSFNLATLVECPCVCVEETKLNLLHFSLELSRLP